jgi:hypothetical protein
MSRSTRRTPIFGNAGCASQKNWKHANHGVERVRVRQALTADPEHVLSPTKYEVSEEWLGPRDGTHFWAAATPRDMRK